MTIVASTQGFETQELALQASQDYLLQLFPDIDLTITSHLFGVVQTNDNFFRLQQNIEYDLFETQEYTIKQVNDI